jgi:hypothetical protein
MWVGGILALGLVSMVAYQYVERYLAQQELDEVIARLHATDPRWRLADIEADRRVVPAEENSALIILAARGLLPEKWPPRALQSLDDLPPPVALREEQAAKLATELKSAHAALQKARELKDRPFGRHKLEYAPDFLSTLIADQQQTRDIAMLLHLDICDAAHRKDTAQAWASTVALLNAGRSLGDEPLLISALIRIAVDGITIRALERIVAQGEMQPKHLEERQRTLAEEAHVPYFLIGVRGERAGNDRLLSNIETGKLSLMDTLETGARGKRGESTSWLNPMNDFLAGAMVRRSHATLLRLETELVEAASLAPEDRYRSIAAVDAAFRAAVSPTDRSQIMARLLFPAVVKIAEAEQRMHTHLECCVAGLAAERFRLTTARWPKSLDELVQAGLLDAIPIDLFDGAPLRMRHTKDGVVIYSIGPSRQYDGTMLDTFEDLNPNAIRVEFRLWDPARRRQPPFPAPKAEGP